MHRRGLLVLHFSLVFIFSEFLLESAAVAQFDPNRVLATYNFDAHEDDQHTLVFFATNRLVLKTKDGEEAWRAMAPDHKMFVAAQENPVAGWVRVKDLQKSLDPSDPKLKTGSLDGLSIAEFTPNYRLVRKIDDLPFLRNDIQTDGMSIFDYLWTKDVLIYVHGFNNDFQTAILRAARLKRDLKYKGHVVVYSWPSTGGMFGFNEYREDERRYKQSLPAVAAFLEKLTLDKDGTTSGRGKRNVLAHSMGNRVFLHGLAHMLRNRKSKELLKHKLLSRVVLAAPDMEVKDFEEHAKFIQYYCMKKNSSLLMHASSNIAVGTSEWLHSDERVGRRGANVEGLLTIDASEIKSPWLEFGHGYYASDDRMVKIMAGFFDGNKGL